MRLDRELTCGELVELVTDYFEGALGRPMSSASRSTSCSASVRAYLEQMRATVAMSGRRRAEDIPPELEERLLGTFREWRRL